MQRLLFFLIESCLDEWDHVRFSIQYLSGQYHERVLDCKHLVDPSIRALPPVIADTSYQCTLESIRQYARDVTPAGAGSIVEDLRGETIAVNVAQSRTFMKDPIPLVWRNMTCLRGSIQHIHLLATVFPSKVRVKATSPRGFARGQLEAFVKRYEGRTSLSCMGKVFDFLNSSQASPVTCPLISPVKKFS